MALASIRVAGSGITHFWERHKMKKHDKEIEQERKREKEMELQNSEKLRNQRNTIQHFTHPHPLHKLHLSSTFQCGSCQVSSASGWAYSCEEAGCNYFLHEVCSGDPVNHKPVLVGAGGQAHHDTGASSSFTTFAHKDHPVNEVHSNMDFQCDHCFTNGTGRRYKCNDCDIHLHLVCAKHPTRLSTFLHPQHELEFQTKKRFRRCQICNHSLKTGQKGLNLKVYSCKECKFWVHPTCSQLPQYLLHDLHPMHQIQLKRVESAAKTSQCDAKCGSNCTTGWQYICTICSVGFHIECILQHSVPNNSNKGLANMIELFSHLLVASGFGIFDVATSFLF